MANHMWVCPTKNQDEFYNIKRLRSLLVEEFPEYHFSILYDGSMTVRSKKIDYLFEMWFYTSCKFVDKHSKSSMIDDLDRMGMEDLSDSLIEYLENGADPERCIEIRHTQYFDEISDICSWMRWYFKAIIFDEGIHPEFVLPWFTVDKPIHHNRKPKGGLIKKFGRWLDSIDPLG